MNNKEASTQAVGQNEQAILAYFKSASDAEKAAKELKESMNLSQENLKIDQFNSVTGTGDGNDVISNPITGEISSHATIVGGENDLSSRGSGILLGASPVVSGMSDGDMQMVTGRNFQLVAIVGKNEVERALKVIEKCGGHH
ncbi:hypothetical protein OS242_17895 [Tumebacillus sp. DT12]|uniref:Uncharacterized protein n=1 Tax=Tumebacillus lacus TaxID=2995335 RepID=A0ABT3X4J2_9BACL|nr:hypothetical protein [Tumebacillus lacus]MCX7571820.1 hypothetical protein [Tumebacillus lacus]